MRSLVIAAIALIGFAPDASRAAEVSVRVVTIEDPRSSSEYAELRFTAHAGEANHLTLSQADGEMTVQDRGAPLQAGDGCRSLHEHVLACRSPGGHRLALAHVQTLDGADRITLGEGVGGEFDGGEGDDHIAAGPAGAWLRGGLGDDVLAGGDGDDGLVAGPGRDRVAGGAGDDHLADGDGGDVSFDTFDGGTGRDGISYAGRREPVRVDLRAGFGGVGAERDAVVGVEDAEGGRASDVIVGDDGPNRLRGGHVNGRVGDRIDGLGGDDQLTGARGRDTLRGGSGDDELVGYGGADRFHGGSGDDHLDVWLDFDGPQALARVRCGAGDDMVNASHRRQMIPADCEVVWAENLRIRLNRDAGRRLRSLTVSWPNLSAFAPCRARLRFSARGAGLAVATARLARQRAPRGAPVRRRGGVRALRSVDVQVQSSYRCNGPYSGRRSLPGSFFRTWL